MPLELIEITSDRAVERKNLPEVTATVLREAEGNLAAPVCWLISEQAQPMFAQLTEVVADKEA